MIFRVTCIIAVLTLATTVRIRGSNEPIPSQWGQEIAGVQLSLSASTNVLAKGSKYTFSCRVRNGSTNEVVFVKSNPKLDFQIFLKDRSGESRRLSPDPSIIPTFSTQLHELKAGEVYAQNVELKIDKAIPVGKYKARSELIIFVNPPKDKSELAKHKQQVISNTVEVEVR